MHDGPSVIQAVDISLDTLAVALAENQATGSELQGGIHEGFAPPAVVMYRAVAVAGVEGMAQLMTDRLSVFNSADHAVAGLADGDSVGAFIHDIVGDQNHSVMPGALELPVSFAF